MQPHTVRFQSDTRGLTKRLKKCFRFHSVPALRQQCLPWVAYTTGRAMTACASEASVCMHLLRQHLYAETSCCPGREAPRQGWSIHIPQHTGDTGTALQQSSFSDGGLLGTSAIESGGLHNDAAEGPEFGLSDGLPRSLSEADSQGVQTGLPLSSTLGTDLQAGSQRFETMGRTLRAGEGDSLSETARRRARSRKPRFAFPRKDGNEEGHQEAVSFRGTDTLKDQSQVCSCSVVAVLADASSKAKGKDAN